MSYIPQKWEEYTFTNSSDFNEWKISIEENTGSHFTSKEKRVHVNTKTEYYRCVRKGSNTSAKCLSCMIVIYGKEDVKVKFYPEHIVHSTRVYSTCFHCNKTFKTKALCRKHMTAHGFGTTNKSTRLVLCPAPDCQLQLVSYKAYVTHLVDMHSYVPRKEVYNMENISDFESWKGSVQRQTRSKFVIRGRKSGPVAKIYYKCHRDGYYFPTHSIRSLKSQGSNKLNGSCPARMDVSITEGKVKVEFYTEHFGHDCPLAALTLSREERSEIAGKLSVGVPITRILSDVRDNTNSINQRFHLLERQDIHNVIRDYNLHNSVRSHADDAISVSLWVKMINEYEDSPVLFFKQQGEIPVDDFLTKDDVVLIISTSFEINIGKRFAHNIICIDSTHGLNNYDFLLHNILTVDEFGNGVPIGHCFSNRKDSKLLEFFFSQMRSVLGTICPNVVMTDDDPAIINGWNAVMGPPKKHLLCTWHILRNWKNNLKKIRNEEKENLVRQDLKIIMMETDEEVFKKSLDELIINLQEDPETKDFGSYFMNHYANRVEKWAYSHRKYAGINTNMFVENLHKQLKHCYLHGKKCRRLDEAINCLMQLTRDKLFERGIKIQKKKRSEKQKRIENAHAKRLEVPKIQITGDNEWLVLSTKLISSYVVRKTETTWNNCECNLKCSVCNICVHSYRCSCPDSVIYMNICKHIHAVHSNYDDTETTTKPKCLEVDPEYTLPDTTAIIPQVSNVDKLNSLLGEYKKFEGGISDDDERQIGKLLDKCLMIVKNGKSDYKILDNVSNKRNIEQQPRYYSTKKKRKISPDTSSTVSVDIMKQEISKPLKTNISTSFDHSYCKKI